MSPIPYGRQSINEADVEAVVEVLRSDFLTQGPAIARFEQVVASFTGSKYAVAVSSATAALHIGALALGLAPGKRLWTVPNTFVASANCALYCGAEVDFVDIDPRTYNLSLEALSQKLKHAAASGSLPDILVPVHFSGQPCQMREISELCRVYGVRIMEDASHAIGAEYLGEKVGSGSFSEVTVFSFHPVKILTTGEGGMLITNNPELYEKLLLLRSHGITRDLRFMEETSGDPWKYEQIELGFNYRITDLQACLGISQMKRLPLFIDKRRQLAQRYSQLLSDLPLIAPWQHPECASSWHLYVVQVDATSTHVTRREVFDYLKTHQIYPQVHYIPVHTQPWYRRLGFKHGQFPVSESYYSQTITLPLYYELSDEEQMRVVTALSRLFQGSRP